MAQIGANVPLAARAAREVPGTASGAVIDMSLVDHLFAQLCLHLQGYGLMAQTVMIWMCELLKLELLQPSFVRYLSNVSGIQSCSQQAKRMLLLYPH